jgi:sugar lactone lactonase YvrE
MFRPIRRAQVGGDYTDIVDITTNINTQRLQSDTYSNFLTKYMSTNPLFYSTLRQISSSQYQNILNFPSNILDASVKYNSTLSSLSDIAVSVQTLSSQMVINNRSSATAKHGASTNYHIQMGIYEKYSTMYSISSVLYSSMKTSYIKLSSEISSAISDIEQTYSTLGYIPSDYLVGIDTIILNDVSTFNSTYSNVLNQVGGAISTYRNQDDYNTAVEHSTTLTRINASTILRYINYSTVQIPEAKRALSIASSMYTSQYVRSTNDTSSGQMTYVYNSTLSSLRKLSTLIENDTSTINSLYANYFTALAAISANTYLNSYSTSVNNEGQAYIVYNSTVTIMEEIETIYSMTLNRLSIPSTLINSIGIQSGGGIYNPTIIVSTLLCARNDTDCNKMGNFLYKYINTYFTLSTALPRYYSNYQSTMNIRQYWERYTPQYVSTLLTDVLANLDRHLTTALADVSRLTTVISGYEHEQSTLRERFSKSHILLSTVLFTSEELNMLLDSGGIFYMSENVKATTTTTTTTKLPPGVAPSGSVVPDSVVPEIITTTLVTNQTTSTIPSPFAMARDTNGNVYVTCNSDNVIYKQTSFVATVKQKVILVSNGTPYGIAIDSNNIMYVMVEEDDPSLNKFFCINMYDANLRYIRKMYIQTYDYSVQENYFSNAMYISVDTSNIYVIDTDNNRICKISKSQYITIPDNSQLPINTGIPISKITVYNINTPLNSGILPATGTLIYSSTADGLGKITNEVISEIPSSIVYPMYLSFNSNGTIYVLGGYNSNIIYSFTETNLTPVQICILPTSNAISFIVSLPSIYYIDSTRENIQRFTIQSGGESSIPPLILITTSDYTPSNISTQYATDKDTYITTLQNYSTTKFSLQQAALTSTIAYQNILAANIKTSMLRQKYINQKQLLQTSLDSVSTVLSTQYAISSILAIKLAEYNLNSIQNANKIQSLYSTNASTIAQYKLTIETVNSMLLNLYNSENLYYQNTLTVISSYIKIGSFQQQIYDYNRGASINRGDISTISTFSENINTYMKYLNSEILYKSYYIYTKNLYENENANIATGVKHENLLSPASYNRLEYNYDLYIAEVNNAISYRKTHTTTLLRTLVSTIFPIFEKGDVDVVYNIQHTTMSSMGPYINTVDNIVYFGDSVSSMLFNYVPLRTNIFNDVVDIPTTTIPTCDADKITINNSPVYQTSTTVPTTTKTTTVYGIQGRYVELTKDNNIFEILQVIVVDSNGKNVAFKANVTIKAGTASVSSSGLPSYVTNGRYSSASLYTLPIFKQTTPLANVLPTLSADTYVGIQDNNSLNAYTAAQLGGAINDIFQVSGAASVVIDLGATYDITAITYLKYSTGYSPVGLTVSVLDSTQTTLISIPVNVDIQSTTFDLRLDKTNINTPIRINPVRYGVCGIFGRYVRMAPSTNTYNYNISQIVVVSSNGTNLALNMGISAYIGGTNLSDQVKLVLNGTYNSLPSAQSFTATSSNSSDYILIDLGSEVEINAVNIYYTLSDSSTYRGATNSAIVSILTEDYLEAASQTTTAYHLVTLKETLDFHNVESAVTCPITLQWAPYYGIAGIICRYVKLFKATGELAFSKIEIVDKTGLDIAQFGAVTINPLNQSNLSILNGVADYHGTRPKLTGYASGGLANQSYIVDFGSLCEVCCVRLYGCSDSPNLSNGIIISLYDSQPSGNTPLISYTTNITSINTINSFDTRYEPVNSVYPTTVERKVTRYGLSGVYAQSVRVYGGNSTTQIIDSTGTNINISGICVSTNQQTGGYYTFRFNTRMYEINSVITSLANIRVELYDCYDVLVSNKLTLVPIVITTPTTSYYADFRKQHGYINRYAPVKPFLNRQYGIGGQGVKTRYVKIYPRNSITPLYISQILAIDETGKNRAYQKESVCVANGTTTFPSTRVNSVDGFYEAQIDTSEFLRLFFQKYKRKGLDSSFQTSSDYYAIDLGDVYDINSIIYVCPDGYGAQCEGVIIQLIDSQFNVVATQMVTSLAKIFGVDILDFRNNPSISPARAPNYLEASQRSIKTSSDGCGILVQYIRIEQTQRGRGIQLSQISVKDTNNFNIAQYKPTYANTQLQYSYRVVDGNITIKDPRLAYCSNVIDNAYIEVNLESEYSLKSVNITRVESSLLDNSRRDDFNSLTLKLYNSNYDLIGSFIGFVSSDVQNTFNLVDSSRPRTLGDVPLTSYNILYLSTIGVQASDQITAYKYNSGLLATSYISTFSTLNVIPPILSVPLSCNSAPAPPTRYTRINGGIPTMYVRVYNIDSYIQVSQLMVYDTTGTNVAYQKPARATSTLPERYAQYATDGYGGFFHTGRIEPYCFISGNNRYDYLEINLGATYNIIAANYVPPARNTSRNVGTRIQLLDSNRIILNEYSSSGGMIDFRIPTLPIVELNTIISPIITLYQLLTFNPMIISVTDSGIVYSIDSNGGNNNLYITKGTTTQTLNYSATMNPTALCSFGETTYCFNSATNSILFFNGNSLSYQSRPLGVTLYGSAHSLAVDSANTNLFISENKSMGRLYRYSLSSFTISTNIYTADNMVSMVVTSDNNLIVCFRSSAIKLSGIMGGTQVATTPYVSNSDAFCNITGNIGLSGITIDRINNIVFISDIGSSTFGGVTNANVVYAIKPDGTYFILAGKPGVSGRTGDNGISTNALFSSPYSLIFKPSLGGIFVADRGNARIRMINLLTSNVAPISTTTALPSLFKTTTLLGNDLATSTIAPYIIDTNSSLPIIRLPDTEIAPSNFTLLTNTSDTIHFTQNVPVIFELFSAASSENQCCHVSATGILYVYRNSRISSYSVNVSGGLTFLADIDVSDLGTITSITSDSIFVYIVSTTYNNIYKIPYTVNRFDFPSAYIGYDAEYSSYKVTTGNFYAVCHYNGIIYFTVDSTLRWCPNIDGGTITTIIGGGRQTFPYYSFNGGDSVSSRPLNSVPTNILLNNPCSIAVDSLGNVYFGDSATNSIQVFTHIGSTNLVYPVAGAFRANSEFPDMNRIPYLNTVSRIGKFSAYSININGPSSLTFDSDMNLICASSVGCQIYRITNLNGFEPQVEIISGVGVDINNLQPYNSPRSTAKYASLNNPTSISYSPNSNSFILVDSGNNAIRQITEVTDMVLYKGNNGIMPYGYIKSYGSYTLIKSLVVHEDTTMYYIDSGTLYRVVSVGSTTSMRTGLSPQSNLCIYNQIYIYIINSPSLGNYEVGEINTLTNAYRAVFSLSSITRTTSTLEYNLCVHENGCLFISYNQKLYYIYLKAKNISILEIGYLANGFGQMCLDSLNNLYVIENNTRISKFALTFVYTPQNTPLVLTIMPLMDDLITTTTSMSTTTMSTTTMNTTTTSTTTMNTTTTSTTTTRIEYLFPIYGLTVSNGAPDNRFIYYCDYTTLYCQHVTDATRNWKLSGLNNPQGIFYYTSSSGGVNTIYIADTLNNRLCSINITQNVFVTVRTFNNPNGVFIFNNTKYVTDATDGGSIWIYSGSSWISIRTTEEPIGIVVNASRIYYSTLSSIYYITITTNVTTKINIPNTQEFSQLTIDSVTNIVYAPNTNGNIYAVTPSNGWSILNNIPYYTPYQIALSSNTVYYSIDSNIQSFNINQTASCVKINSWQFGNQNSLILNPQRENYNYNIKSILCYNDTLYFATKTQIFKLQTQFTDATQSYSILGGGDIATFPSHPLLYKLTNVSSIGVSYDENIFVSDGTSVIKIDNREIFIPNYIYTLVGSALLSTIVSPYNGDGQIASLSYLRSPGGACYDSYGNIYIADTGNTSIRRINMESGVISTLYTYSSGAVSTSSQYLVPSESIIDVQVDSAGNIYSLTPTRLYKTDTAGTIQLCTVPAASGYARSMRFDKNGNLYVVCSFMLVGSISFVAASESITQESLDAEYIALYGGLSNNISNYSASSLYGIFKEKVRLYTIAYTNYNLPYTIYSILWDIQNVLYSPTVLDNIRLIGLNTSAINTADVLRLSTLGFGFTSMCYLIISNSSTLSHAGDYEYLLDLVSKYRSSQAVTYFPTFGWSGIADTGGTLNVRNHLRELNSAFLTAFETAKTSILLSSTSVSNRLFGYGNFAEISYMVARPGSLVSIYNEALTTKTTANNNYTNALDTYTQHTNTFTNPPLKDLSTVAGFNLNTYVNTYKKTNILVLAPGSRAFNSTSPITTAIHEGLGIAFDLNNNLYVADHYNNKIYMYSADNTTYSSVLDMGSYKPYGLAVWADKLYVSCNSSSVKYLPACEAHRIITYPLSTFSTATPVATPSNFCGTGTKATSYIYDKIPITTSINLSNPQLLSIDTKGRLLFTQSNLHSLLMIPLSDVVGSIQNITKIEIKSSVLGKSVNFYSIYIYNSTGTAVQIYPATGNAPSPSSPVILRYSLDAANPVWNKTITQQNIASLIIKSNSPDAIGMKVILYDNFGTNVSTRNVTHKVLDSAGCTISYNPNISSES